MFAGVVVEAEEDFGEALLHDLLDGLAHGEEAAGDARDARAVPLEQMLERRLVAAARGADERVVRQFVGWLQRFAPRRVTGFDSPSIIIRFDARGKPRAGEFPGRGDYQRAGVGLQPRR